MERSGQNSAAPVAGGDIFGQRAGVAAPDCQPLLSSGLQGPRPRAEAGEPQGHAPRPLPPTERGTKMGVGRRREGRGGQEILKATLLLQV